MAFFGQPGFSVGPYSYPAQPGVFDRVLQVGDLATNLFGLYQKFKDKSLKDVVNKIAVGRELYGDQPLPIDEALGQQLEKVSGFQLPKITDESRQKTLSEIISSGGATVPGRELTDPAIAEAQAPTVGSYAPLPGKKPKSLEELIVSRMTGGKGMGSLDTNQALSLWQQLKGKEPKLYKGPGGLYNTKGEKVSTFPEETTTIYDPVKGGTTTVQGSNVKIAPHPWTDPFELAKFRSNLENNQPTTYVVPDETGAPAGATTYKGKVHFGPRKGEGGVSFITPDEASSNPGKVWPKGTRVIKDDDPAWKSAVNQANQIVKSDLTMTGATPEQIAKRQGEVAKAIYPEIQGGPAGKGTSTPKAGGIDLSTPQGIDAAYQDAIKKGKDPAQAKALRDKLIQGLNQ